MEIYLDMTIFFGGWLVAQILFKGYEAHVPFVNRISKLAVLCLIFLAIYYFGGRWVFYSLLPRFCAKKWGVYCVISLTML